jgi:hypothetical protein
MNDKEKITKIIYENLPAINPWQEKSVEKCLFEWWATGRSNQSLRLTEEGKSAFELAEIAYYEYPLINSADDLEKIRFTGFTINLGKKLKCPFYVGYKNKLKKSVYIRLYDSKIAMMVSLYGSFQEYFNTL